MEGVYKKLANFLDKLPGGYPATESGVELRILKNLFNKEEAELTMALSPMPESPSKIAARLNEDASVLAGKLDAMSKKGLIFRVRSRSGKPLHGDEFHHRHLGIPAQQAQPGAHQRCR